MKHIDLDPSGREVPIDEIGTMMFTKNRLLLASRRAARDGDRKTALDLTGQVEEIGLEMFAQGAENEGYRALEMSLFY